MVGRSWSPSFSFSPKLATMIGFVQTRSNDSMNLKNKQYKTYQLKLQYDPLSPHPNTKCLTTIERDLPSSIRFSETHCFYNSLFCERLDTSTESNVPASGCTGRLHSVEIMIDIGRWSQWSPSSHWTPSAHWSPSRQWSQSCHGSFWSQEGPYGHCNVFDPWRTRRVRFVDCSFKCISSRSVMCLLAGAQADYAPWNYDRIWVTVLMTSCCERSAHEVNWSIETHGWLCVSSCTPKHIALFCCFMPS